MNNEDLSLLKEQTEQLKAIFQKHEPIKKDGSYDTEKVKLATSEMARFILEENEASALLSWMDENEFWTSPASTKFHGNKAGGLCAHSLLVTYQALNFAEIVATNFMTSKMSDAFSFSCRDIFLSTIAHDFCKSGFYSTKQRRTKDYTGSVKYETYFVAKDDNRNLGHGNESVLRLLEILPSEAKNRTLIEAISRHMGFSDITDMEKINYSNFLENPLVLLVQIADQSAAQWWDL